MTEPLVFNLSQPLAGLVHLTNFEAAFVLTFPGLFHLTTSLPINYGKRIIMGGKFRNEKPLLNSQLN